MLNEFKRTNCLLHSIYSYFFYVYSLQVLISKWNTMKWNELIFCTYIFHVQWKRRCKDHQYTAIREFNIKKRVRSVWAAKDKNAKRRSCLKRNYAIKIYVCENRFLWNNMLCFQLRVYFSSFIWNTDTVYTMWSEWKLKYCSYIKKNAIFTLNSEYVMKFCSTSLPIVRLLFLF